jgi:HEPN domain-containing protein
MNEETVRLWCIKADTVCFHMQHCVEKYLKAFLVINGTEIPRTHNIALILQKCIEIEERFTVLKALEPGVLTAYAVQTRYPDDFYMPSIEEASQAKLLAVKVKTFVTELLKQ